MSHFLVGRQFGFDRGFEFFDESEALGEDHLSTPGVTRLATSLLDGFAEQEKPFFLLVHYFDPHYTYKRHPEVGFAGPGGGRLKGGESIAQLRQMLPDMTGEEVAFLLDLYDEEIRFTDSGVGRLINHLRTRGLYDKTVIVLVADHGEEFLEHGWIGHTRTLYEELMWVPLIMRVPDGADRGRVVRQPVSLVSVMPSLLDLADVDIPELRMQSHSIVRFLDSEATSEGPEPVFFEVDFDPIFAKYVETKTAHKKAIVLSPFKLVRDDQSGKLELFDLARDSREETNLAERRPDIARTLLPTLAAHVAFARGEPIPTRETHLSPDQIERLIRLGYVSPQKVQPERQD